MNAFSQAVNFVKMQGAGNDYVYIMALDAVPENLPLLAKKISDRNFGVGGDGLVAVMKSERADFRMRMFNADGSEAQMCGNAIRCIGKLVYEKGLTHDTSVTIETLAGIRTLDLTVSDGVVTSVRVDMGKPILEAEHVPVIHDGKGPVVNKEVDVDGMLFRITAVSMGNPHGVLFVNSISDDMVHNIGPRLEDADIWPEKANIEFVTVNNRREMSMRVWERGSGETLACGTGACASVVAAVLNGLTDRKVTVRLRGGDLTVEWSEADGHVYLTGPAVMVAEGVYYPKSSPLMV